MPLRPNELQTLLSRVRAGDTDAVREVINTCRPTIWREIRGHLGQSLRTLFDPADILQEVWMDFFTRRVHQQTFEVEAELRRYLARMSRNIIIELQRRYLFTQKRNLKRQVPLDSPTVSTECDLIDHCLAAEEKVDFEDRWECLLSPLNPRVRRVLTMICAGYSQREVAEVLGVNERIIRRTLGSVREVQPAPHEGIMDIAIGQL